MLKSITAAAFCLLFPGLGFVVFDRVTDGAVYFFAILLIAVVGILFPPLWLLIPVLWLVSVVHALFI
jgi:hypothetical protein